MNSTPYSNEFEIRKTAHAALLARYARDYPSLLLLSAFPLVQRVHFLAQQQDLESYFQWQFDASSSFLQREWNPHSSTSVLQDAPIYYKRWDKETLHAMLEFGRKGTQRFVVVLLWEEEKQKFWQKDIKYEEQQELEQEQTKESEKLEFKSWKYYNTKEVLNWEEYLSDGWELVIDLTDQKFNKLKTIIPSDIAEEDESDADYWDQYPASDDKDVAASSESSVQNNRSSGDDDNGESYWDQYGQPLGNRHSTFKTISSSKTLTKSLLDECIHASGKISNVGIENSAFNDNGLETVTNNSKVRFDKTENDREENQNGNTIETALLTSFPPPNDEPAQIDRIQHQETPEKETERLTISTTSPLSSSVQKEALNNEIQTFVSDAVRSVYGMAKLNGISKEKFLELAWDAVTKE
ncbi:4157_t:CDS:2 [Ambispora gerdemannii]|uniref:4157_t:CDS:1 n=1 Tax=Ambispora gerdemannii TaxID=144530 RepID=A0A9N9BA16_9GLOM|nr:4157_t:CDS:2 [Ambispora gerdemannii]